MLVRLRTAAFVIFLTLVTVVLAIIASPSLLLGGGAARAVAQLWSRLALATLRVFCGLKHCFLGEARLPTGGALIAANHQSMWETIFLYASLEKPAIVFKRELLEVPIYGWWAARSGSIAVNRKDGVKALKKLTRDASDRIDEGFQVVIFPEGTRSPPGARPKIQPGIASVYLAMNEPCHVVAHDSGRFWRMPGGLTSLKYPGVITVTADRVIEAGLARKTFMRELETTLGQPATREMVEC